MGLDDKVALITGGGSGIGRAIAIRFAKEGATVAVAGRRESLCREVAQEIKAGNGKAYAAQVDVRSEASVQKMIEDVSVEYGRIDVLVNNAGVNLMRDLSDTREEEWDNLIDTNLKGPFLCCKHAIPIMKGTGAGSIINIGSDLAFVGSPARTAYCASKGGLVLLTRALALELAQHSIRVNCLCPAAVSTPMLDEYLSAQKDPELGRRRLQEFIPVGRIGLPEDVAGAAVYLASDGSSYVTGAVLMIDGGLTAR